MSDDHLTPVPPYCGEIKRTTERPWIQFVTIEDESGFTVKATITVTTTLEPGDFIREPESAEDAERLAREVIESECPSTWNIEAVVMEVDAS